MDAKTRSYLRSLVSTACQDSPKKDSFVVENGKFKMTLRGKAETWESLTHFMGVPSTADAKHGSDSLAYTWHSVADRVFGPGGTMSRYLPGYEHRNEQIHVSRLVQRTIEMSDVAAIEAGTGTGKSLAYLVPAISTGKRIVVATSNKLLQQQLYKKDLPFLAERLFPDLTYALQMGKSNYMCMLKAGDVDEISPYLEEWANTTDTGLLEDINFDANWIELKSIRIDDDCTGRKCPLFDDCWYYQAKQEAQEAQVIITNHTLLAMNTLYPDAQILPDHDILIVDEAHSLPEYFRMAVGDEMSYNSVTDLIEKAQKFVVIGKVQEGLYQFQQEIEKIVSGSSEKFQIGIPREKEIESAKNLCVHLLDLGEALELESGGKSTPEEIKCSNMADSARKLAYRFSDFAGPVEGVMVRWISIKANGSLGFVALPHDISYLVKQALGYVFDERPNPKPVIFTSATLAAPDFEAFARELGLYNDGYIEALTMQVDSPFDYQKNAMLYVPDAASPDPKDVGWKAMVTETMLGLVNASNGGALLLFSSNDMLNYAYESLYRTFEHNGFEVYRQGQLPKSEIVNRMRAAKNVVVFATQGFYEGVDVQGENLRLTVIDKLPFEAPSPLLSAQEDAAKVRGDNPFVTIHLPRAIRKTKQAFGRLIRTREDKGVVAILDTRIRTKPYGRYQVYPALPPARYVKSTYVAADFLHGCGFAGNRKVENYTVEEKFNVTRGADWMEFMGEVV